MSKTGLLLLNLGTPDAPDSASVRSYLREFLSDPYVIDIPAPIRWLLLNFIILPFRSKQSSVLYQSIWTDQGSPLLVNSQALASSVNESAGEEVAVALGMRYGQPSVASAIQELVDQSCDRFIVLPLFPQYALATTHSVIQEVLACFASHGYRDEITIIEDFFEHPDFIAACAEVAREPLLDFQPDHVLMSYHGLPERHITKAGCLPTNCSRQAACKPVQGSNLKCYRAQAYATSRALAKALDLEAYSVAFQSRLGRIPWIKPYTDLVLPELAEQGVKKLAIVCPSFVSDCLETLEEINIRAREQWQALGGTAFCYIPCVNAHPRWVEAVLSIAGAQTPGSF